jgi:type I restriction enzyme, S subunit
MTIPDGWIEKKLGDIAIISSGATPSRSDATYWNGDIPWITTAEVNFNTITDTKEKITSFGLNNSSAKLFPINTLLIAMYGQGKTRGKVAKLGIQATTNQACAAIIISENYSHEFYFSYLEFKYDFLRSLSNAGGQENLSTSIIKSIIIPVPPLPEQIKIADILSTWDRVIEAQEKLITNSEAVKKSLMQQLLTGKKRLSGFSGAWEEVKLGEVGDISSAGVDKKTINGETKVRLLNFVDVFRREKLFNHELTQEVTSPKDKIHKCNVKKGDIFFTPSSETREELAMSSVAYEDMENVVYSYHIVRFRLKQKWDMNFCSFIFQTEQFRKQVYRLGDGSGQRYVISQDGFRNIKIKIPCLDEQIAIGNILNTASETIIMQKQKLSLLKQEKSALMQDLLTGKRRVNVDINLKEEEA